MIDSKMLELVRKHGTKFLQLYDSACVKGSAVLSVSNKPQATVERVSGFRLQQTGDRLVATKLKEKSHEAKMTTEVTQVLVCVIGRSSCSPS